MIEKNRRSIRLKEYDYSEPGEYFVTICTKDRVHLFGNIDSDGMHENELGNVVRHCWIEIPNHFPNVELDEFVVMPNHVHIVINPVGVQNIEPLPNRYQHVTPGSVGSIVRSFKSAVTRWCRKNEYPHIVWQRNYFEHIIRDDKSLDRIREYIASNPEQWPYDKENTQQETRDKFDEWLSAIGRQPISRA